MGNYLGFESLLNTSDSAKNSIASALVEQVHKCLDYQITSCDIQSYNAIVTAEVTTFDSASILSDYQNSRDAYLSSVDAVIDGSSKDMNILWSFFWTASTTIPALLLLL